jgi:secreted protein with Ig-like and vWFA domain
MKSSYYTTLAEKTDAVRTKYSYRISPAFSLTQTHIQIATDMRRNIRILRFISGEV